MGGMGGGGGRGGYGGGGGGGDMGAANTMAAPTAVVRWESAPLVRAALKVAEGPEFNETISKYAGDYYVISVTRADPAGGGRGYGRSGGDGQWGPPGGDQDPAKAEERRKAMQARQLEATSIKRGPDAVHPERIIDHLQSNSGMVTLYLFPRSQKLEEGIKELSFETSMGPMSVKAKFNLKEFDQASLKGL
jgi:hypothetical protein